ncbi:RNA-binding S4 domain-containing protein [Paenibacillus sp. TRM 82003]|uniref:RNA-binding S4 domain-containing protein n=1 Tax=Kineococcus sp. TRM81007 TaxID=2925831 RepID=UPI001F5819D7|nr:RNA-binding S4 domain-containing protein [Kineococcus sp. TRM81007]MCI2239990.1 RNA-binding S4 domain-containing protein [Kineococcus sp. TRM81007]MCI3925705.1 RNA-binding S4 domain-containing protein [Paenibacillus sp. TRM 82003]
MSAQRDVEVTGTVRLGQFLKLVGAVDSGGEAREVLAAGEVSVNGEVDDRRGRQLSDGDVVELGGQEWRVLVG